MVHERIREIEESECLAAVYLSSCDVTTKKLQQGRQLDFPSRVYTTKGPVKAALLTDTGASAMGFVDSKFAKLNKLPLVKMTKPCRLRLADNELASSIIDKIAQVKIAIGDHTEECWCLVTTIGNFDLILGMPWLELHDPYISFKERSITFQSDYCMSNCLLHHKPAKEFSKGKDVTANESKWKTEDIAEISAYAFLRLSEDRRNQTIALWPEDFERLEYEYERPEYEGPDHPGLTSDVAAITPEDYEQFFHKLRKSPITIEELKEKVPKVYHRWIEVWSPIEANKLPPHRSVDHAIELQKDAVPPAKRAYGMSREQATVVKEYVDDMLGKGYIRRSISPYAAPVLIVKKPDGGLRICIDYRALNALTIRNRNAPPLIRETLSRLCAAKIYSKFDIIAAFNEIRMKEGDEHKTAFLTRYGLFEYVVMPFGLCNAPSTFQAFINDVLREYLDIFCSAYLDDILIYSNSKDEHIEHVGKVLEQLKKAGLFLDINKCQFHVKEIKYLGLIITVDGLKMDPRKIDTILQWKAPRCTKDVQSFLGFANFYRRFIHGYSRIAAPLTSLTRATTSKEFAYPWALDGAEQRAFDTLKKAFTTAPVLAHFDPDRETWIESDASDYIVAAVLSQKNDDGVLCPVAFMSKKMSPQECNYEIYDKELLAIIRAFEEWHPELAGTPIEDPIRIITDHKNLEYFMSTKQLNRRQARWAEFLSEFNFKISYRPGNQGTKPDSLTRRTGDLPENQDDERVQYQHQTLIKDKHVDEGIRVAVALAPILIDESEVDICDLLAMVYDLSELGDAGSESVPSGCTDNKSGPVNTLLRIKESYQDDEIVQRVIHAKVSQQRKIPPDLVKEGLKLEIGDCEVINGLLYIGKRLYVPDNPELRTDVIKYIHESLPGGHAGRSSTYDRVSEYYYWPRMTSTVAQYVKNCHICKRSKSYREGKQGLLKPLPIPERYFQDISIDFITPLPLCTRYGRLYQHIMVVIDRLSKKRKFIPLDSIEVEAVVQAFVDWVWREEGYPVTIVSDRGTQFVAYFWKRLCERIGTTPKLSTAFHPETDGQTENANASLKQFLRAYVNYNQDDWVDFLAVAEFEANSDRNASSGISPFMATKGYVPRSGLEPPTPWDSDASQRAKREVTAADDFIQKIDNLRGYLRSQLKWSQALQAEQANRYRQPATAFRVGDMVMLDRRNIKTQRPSKSLDHKNLGPFKIIKAYHGNSAYELELPKSMNGVHPVFHPWLLHLDDGNPLPGQKEPPPPPVHINTDGADYEVEGILDARINKRILDPNTRRKGCLMYKIKYRGYDDEPEWQPYTDAAGCPDLVADFHHTNAGKPGPHSSFQTPEGWEPLLAALLLHCDQT